MPLAPTRIAFCTACFIARRNETRFSSCSAMLRATRYGVHLGLADLEDVQAHLLLGQRLQVLAQPLDALAALADHDARLGGVDRDGDLGAGDALDLDARDAGVRQALADRVAQLAVLGSRSL